MVRTYFFSRSIIYDFFLKKDFFFFQELSGALEMTFEIQPFFKEWQGPARACYPSRHPTLSPI